MDTNTMDQLRMLLEYVAPNLRFGTSFLNSKFRDRAVNDEVMMDKTTGALTYKRQLDGDFIHFDRENIAISEWMMQMRTAYAEDDSITYPTESNCDSFLSTFLIGTLYDFQSFSYENEFVTRIEDGAYYINQYNTPFNISHETNGFFVKVVVRPRDIATVHLLCDVYDRFVRSYDGTDPVYLQEKEKFDETNYDGSNVSIRYTLTYYKDGEIVNTMETTGHAIVQEVCYIPFPEKEVFSRETIDYITLSIDEISMPKISFGLKLKEEEFTDDELQVYEKVKDIDDIGLKYMEVFHYATISDEPFAVPRKENSRIHFFMRMDSVKRLFDRVDTLTASGITIDDVFDPLSGNPVSGKAVAEYIDEILKELQKTLEELQKTLEEKMPNDLILEDNTLYLSVGGKKIGDGQVLPGGSVVGPEPPKIKTYIWIDTNVGGVLKYWNGTEWAPARAVWG